MGLTRRDLQCLFFFVILVTIASNVFFPSFNVLLKSLDNAEVEQAISLNNICLQIGAIIGSCLSGVLLTFMTFSMVMLLSSFCFVISLLFVSLFKGTIHRNTSSRHEFHIINEYFEGIKYVRLNKEIIYYIIIVLMSNMIISFVNTVLPIYNLNVLHGNSENFAMLDSLFSIGSMIAGLMLIYLKKEYKMFNFQTLNIVLSITLIFTIIFPYFIFPYFFMIIIGLINALSGILSNTNLMKKTKEEYVGRVSSTLWMFYSIISPIFSIILTTIESNY
ncbi:MAG: MFS transporter [Methanobrevibacter sp.]|jgi:predicted MFS family arabinose efflux permease|nr:MFS transporter [Candidatus Methanovirga procula]